jgi:hypothetical protein
MNLHQELTKSKKDLEFELNFLKVKVNMKV